MSELLQAALLMAALVVLIPCAVFCAECFAARRGAPPLETDGRTPPQTVVLIPAHNEAQGIEATLAELLPQLGAGMRALVVADNCGDGTAQLARRAGVEVIERFDLTRQGKGYALAFAVEYLRAAPPDIVLVLDADCRAANGTPERLARAAYHYRRPVQAVYLLAPPPHATPAQLVSAFAFRVKNLTRLAGAGRLGLPCLLTGSGMAFPWDTLRVEELAHPALAEDLWLTVRLVCRGVAPLLDADAHVTGEMPSSRRGARRQRTRWEQGHLGALVYGAPQLLRAIAQERQWAPLGLLTDLSVPPLSLLLMLWSVVLVVTAGAAAAGLSSLPLAVSGTAGVILTAGTAAAWLRYGREDFPLGILLSVPEYVIGKLPLYATFVARRQTLWERGERPGEFLD